MPKTPTSSALSREIREKLEVRLFGGGPKFYGRPQVIARALGHTTVRMSERYARPSDESMKAITSALEMDTLMDTSSRVVSVAPKDSPVSGASGEGYLERATGFEHARPAHLCARNASRGAG